MGRFIAYSRDQPSWLRHTVLPRPRGTTMLKRTPDCVAPESRERLRAGGISRSRRISAIVALACCFALIAGCSDKGNAEKPSGGDSASTKGQLFLAADKCSACHNKLSDASGADISYQTLWSESVHAQASVDPYYLATVGHEVELFPDVAADIENTCATCHLAMARGTAEANGDSTAFLGEDWTDAGHPLHALYKDGVSCLVCHQVTAEGLGTDASVSGGFKIDTAKTGLRTLYGPFGLSDAMQKPMRTSIKFTAEQTGHMAKADLCAVCHTLYTTPIAESGEALDQKFPEQVPVLEWQQSSFAAEQSCQSCHMPKAEGSAKISSLAAERRTGVNRHVFVGGNAFLLNLAKSAGGSGSGDSAALDVGIQRTTEFLQTQTASLEVSAIPADDKFAVSVRVNNLAGHKLPTSFPSRRVWLHVTATDSAGNVVFESGAWEANGSIVGNDNDADDTRFEPHYTTITSADQVQIYEAILGDSKGDVTTGVIAATSYLKDNRLLPAGFDKTKALADTAVAGGALGDSDFAGGGDALVYEFPLTASSGRMTVKVELVYQSIGFRWLENLRSSKTAERDTLFDAADKTVNAPVVLASQSVQVP